MKKDLGSTMLDLCVRGERSRKVLRGFIPLERKRNSRVKSSFLTGFTLLEVVLSVAITGVVLLTIYSSFHLCNRVGKRVGSKIDRDARAVLSQLSRDLRSAYLLAEKESNLKFAGSATSINFITVVSLRHNFSGPGEYDLREVGYYLGPGPDEDIYSLIYRINLAPGKETPKVGEHRELTRLAKSLRFTYYDGRVWQKAWNSTEQLPEAVHVSIGLNSRADNSTSEIFSTIVDIP